MQITRIDIEQFKNSDTSVSTPVDHGFCILDTANLIGMADVCKESL